MNNKKCILRYPCAIEDIDRAAGVRAARDAALALMRTLMNARLSDQPDMIYSDPRFFEVLEQVSWDLICAEGDFDDNDFRESLVFDPGWKREQDVVRLAGQALVATILGVDWKSLDLPDVDVADALPVDFIYTKPGRGDRASRVWAESMILEAGHYAAILLQPGVATSGGEAPFEKTEAHLLEAGCRGDIQHYLRIDMVWLIHRLKPALKSLAGDLFYGEQVTQAEVVKKIADLVDDDLRAQIKQRDWRSLAEIRVQTEALVETEAVQ